MMQAFALPADVSGDRAAELLPALRRQIDAVRSGSMTVDAAGVQRFDSASLALLLECRRLLQARKAKLELLHAPAGLVSMAQVYGVHELLGMPAAAALSDA